MENLSQRAGSRVARLKPRDPGSLHRGQRIESAGGLDNNAQCPQRADVEFIHIVPADVLDDRRPALRDRTVGMNNPNPDDQVAGGSISVPPRAARIGGKDTADGPALAACRIKGEKLAVAAKCRLDLAKRDLKSTRLNSSHHSISYAVFCL